VVVVVDTVPLVQRTVVLGLMPLRFVAKQHSLLVIAAVAVVVITREAAEVVVLVAVEITQQQAQRTRAAAVAVMRLAVVELFLLGLRFSHGTLCTSIRRNSIASYCGV
jgi:hypothetical protein